jgi:hypothetical protein
MTIVPPATTVTPDPSPKALTASSGDAATITSGASTTPMVPSLSDGQDWTRVLIHDPPGASPPIIVSNRSINVD